MPSDNRAKQLTIKWASIPGDNGEKKSRGLASRRTVMQRRWLAYELLEDRRLLTADFGDAPQPFPTLISEMGAQQSELGVLTLGALCETEIRRSALRRTRPRTTPRVPTTRTVSFSERSESARSTPN